ncbi:MAG: hypothetical protein ACNYNX_06575 [Leucobacter sp.]
MSEERETQAGAPVEETEASATEVLAAVERAGEVDVVETTAPAPAVVETVVVEEVVVANGSAETVAVAESVSVTESGRPVIAVADELPSAGPSETAPAQTAVLADTAPRDGEIRISADHPMAALYMQTPMPPELKGNRGMGVLISIVATVGFAIVYAGVIALLLAPQLPPSRFLGGLVGELLSWTAIFAAAAFFIGLVVVVLVVGRAGWWAYVLGGFLVALFVWLAAFAGAVVDAESFSALTRLSLGDAVEFALLPQVVIAVLVAREATVWFGAWIGNRGRRVTRANAQAIAEYETALAEVQAKQP